MSAPPESAAVAFSGGASAGSATSRRWGFFVLLAFCLSRLAYYWLGVRFDLRPLERYWQVIDPQLLMTRPLESLLHLHSQPPLWNAYLAVVLHLPEELRAPAFTGSYLLLGLAITWGLFALLGALGVALPLRLAATLIFAASPAMVLYENLLFYTYPALAALVWAALLLHRFLERGSGAALAGWSALLAGLVLTRSLFHLGYLVAACAGLALVAGPQRRRAVRWGTVAILVAASWYLHCWLQFGNFGASSWFGMNLAKMVVRTATPAERSMLATAHPTASILALLPFRPISEYSALVPLPPPTGVPLLDQLENQPGVQNYHHLGYVAVSNRFRSAAVWVILHRPQFYLRGLGTAWRLFFRSAADDKLLGDNALAVEPVERWYRLALGQWRRMSVRDQVGPGEFAWGLAAAYCGAVALGVQHLRREGWRSPRGATVAFMLASVVYVAVVGNGFDIGENNRFGLLVQPFVVALLLLGTARDRRDRECPPV